MYIHMGGSCGREVGWQNRLLTSVTIKSCIQYHSKGGLHKKIINIGLGSQVDEPKMGIGENCLGK